MRITRRQFIKYVSAAAAAAGLSQMAVNNLTQVLANEAQPRVLWLHGQNCTGCTVSVIQNRLRAEVSPILRDANVISEASQNVPILDNLGYKGVQLAPDINAQTTIDDVVLDIFDFNFQPTIIGCTGDLAVRVLEREFDVAPAELVLVVEGAVPTNDRSYCTIGYDQRNHFHATESEIWIQDAVTKIANDAGAVIALGTCASFGGAPAAMSDPAYATTGAKPLSAVTTKTVVNIPGCPPHPEWVVLTLVQLLWDIKKNPSDWDLLKWLDDYNRPKRVLVGALGTAVGVGSGGVKLYEETNHYNCPRRQDYHLGNFVTKLGEPVSGSQAGGCLLRVGCKGPVTRANCPVHGWNDSVSYTAPGSDKTRGSYNAIGSSIGNVNSGDPRWCVSGNFPCIGCTEKGWPDAFTPLVTGYS